MILSNGKIVAKDTPSNLVKNIGVEGTHSDKFYKTLFNWFRINFAGFTKNRIHQFNIIHLGDFRF